MDLRALASPSIHAASSHDRTGDVSSPFENNPVPTPHAQLDMVEEFSDHAIKMVHASTVPQVGTCTWVHVCVRVYVHVLVRAHVCVHTYSCKYVHVRVHVHVHVCMCVGETGGAAVCWQQGGGPCMPGHGGLAEAPHAPGLQRQDTDWATSPPAMWHPVSGW